jgi:hypothetical protein
MLSGLHLKADARRSREKNRSHPAMDPLVADQAQSDRRAGARRTLIRVEQTTLQLTQHRVAFRRLVPGQGVILKRLPARA